MGRIKSLGNIHDIIWRKWVHEFTALLSEYEKALRKQYILKVITSPGICRGGVYTIQYTPVYENRVSFTGSSLSPVI